MAGQCDYNADIAVTDMGGTKLVTSAGVETTVTIYDTAKDPRRTYNTDNSGKAANEDNYIVTPTDGVMKNDRTLGEISISKVDLDAVRYVGGKTAHDTALASGQGHGDATLDGAVYDLYAAEDITHPDGVTGVVDYSKIVDANGNPVWHTMIRDNSGQWVSDYLPILKKDHLVASAKIENGWLTFANLYLGKYYVVERSTGVVIPLRDGALAVSGTYPTVDSRTKAATGQTADTRQGRPAGSTQIGCTRISSALSAKARRWTAVGLTMPTICLLQMATCAMSITTTSPPAMIMRAGM